VFGLFWLLGYQFSPRLADLKDMRFWRLNPKADYGVLHDLGRHTIATKVIVDYWDDLLRLAGSLKLGTVSADAVVRWLHGDKRPRSMARAVSELGRIAKTLYLYVSWNTCLKRDITVVAHLCRSQIKRVTERKNPWPMSNGNVIPTWQRSPAHALG
jgi:TnpA family transposase